MIRFFFKHFLVLLIVVFLYLLMLVPGSFKPGKKEVAWRPKEPVCTMAFSQGELALPELVAWSELDSPTLFALADFQTGFSSALRYALPEAYSPFRPIKTFVPFSPPSLLAAPNSALKLVSPEPFFTMEALSVRQVDDDDSRREIIYPRTVVWMWGNGLPVKAPLNLNSHLKEVGSGKTPTAETQIEIIPAGKKIRLYLKQSSGVPELDSLLMSHLGAVLSAGETGQGKGTHLMGKNISAGGETLCVDWRMSPDIGGN